MGVIFKHHSFNQHMCRKYANTISSIIIFPKNYLNNFLHWKIFSLISTLNLFGILLTRYLYIFLLLRIIYLRGGKKGGGSIHLSRLKSLHLKDGSIYIDREDLKICILITI